MAKAPVRSGPVLGRRLVEIGVLTQEQVNDCQSASLHVGGGNDLAVLELRMILTPEVFSRLLNGHADG